MNRCIVHVCTQSLVARPFPPFFAAGRVWPRDTSMRSGLFGDYSLAMPHVVFHAGGPLNKQHDDPISHDELARETERLDR